MTIVVLWGQEASKGAWWEEASRCHRARKPAREARETGEPGEPAGMAIVVKEASRPVQQGAMEPGSQPARAKVTRKPA